MTGVEGTPKELAERAHQFLAEGEIDSAAEAASRAVQANEADAAAKNVLGVALSLKGDHAGAIHQLERACALQPDNTPYHYNLAMAFERAGDTIRAEALYRRIIQTDPSHPRASSSFQRLSRIHVRAGETGNDRQAAIEEQSAAHAGRRGAAGFGSVYGPLFFAAGLLVLWQLWPTLRFYALFRQTACTVVDARVLRTTLHKGKRQVSVYRPEITFTYAVNDRVYTHKGYSLYDTAEPYAPIFSQFVVDRFQPGMAYPCWVSRIDPQIATLTHSPTASFYAWLLVAIGLAVGAVTVSNRTRANQLIRERSIQEYHKSRDFG